MRSVEEIVALYSTRKKHHQKRLARMMELRAAYRGEMAIPLPELGRNEKPMVANLVAQGLDGIAQRIASTMPSVSCPPARPGFDNAEQNAETRRNVIYGWWSMNRLNQIQRKRARWLVGYSTAPVVIRPDPRRRIPVWHPRDPLTTLPPPGNAIDEVTPPDCIFTFTRTQSWLQAHYPGEMGVLSQPKNAGPDTEYTILEYADAEQIVLVALGQKSTGQMIPGNAYPAARGRPFVTLGPPIPNKAGVCPAVLPSRIGLDDAMGQFDGIIGLYYWQSRLMALGGLAAERDVFPDEWLEARPNETPSIVVEADGLQGIRGEVAGGQIATTHAPPGPQTLSMIDRIERSMRLTGGIPAEMTGESPTNIRTARRGAQVLSSAIDFTIQEAQEIFEASLEEENIRAIAIDKAYFGAETKAFYFTWNGRSGRGSYVPNDTFASDENRVRFSFPGADANDLVVGVGQRIGMQTMSHYRGMELDPMIEDPDLERQRILVESTDQALLQGWQTQVAQGQVPPEDAAFVNLQVMKGDSLATAITAAHDRAQQRQATQASAAPPEAPAPAPPGAPEAQPGLAQPGQGAEAGIAGPGPASQNLMALMQNLRRTSQPV